MTSTISYIINFNKATGVYTLTSTKDELKVDAKHKKYEWLKSQEAGRIVKISDKGRWNSSKDYIGLYDEINSSSSKKKTSTVQTKTQSEVDKSSEVNELKTQFKELQTLKNKLSAENTKLKNENQLLKTENTTLKKEYQEQITSLTKDRDTWKQLYNGSKKPVPAKIKPKPVKKQPKKYKAKMTATLSFTDIFKNKRTEFLPYITIRTEQLDKKPSQSFFKTYCKLVANKGWTHKTYKFGMPIKEADGFNLYKLTSGAKNIKISNISFISIEEYY